MALHIVLLGGTSVIGAACLMLSGGAIFPSAEASSQTKQTIGPMLDAPADGKVGGGKQVESGTPCA